MYKLYNPTTEETYNSTDIISIYEQLYSNVCGECVNLGDPCNNLPKNFFGLPYEKRVHELLINTKCGHDYLLEYE